MKTFLFAFSFLMIPTAFCQFSIDLGNDTIFCSAYPDTVQVNQVLGTNLFIDQGTPPYTYSWYITPYNFPGSSLYFHASTFLNDTTIATPNLLGGLDTLVFYLTLRDANNQVAMDSIIVYSPKFTVGFPLLLESVLLSDSILTGLVNIFGGIPPLSYLWRPNHGLLDSTNANFWTKPTLTTSYYLTVTDSAGCKGTGGTAVIVYVTSLSIESVISEEKNIILYPNPSNGNIFIKDEEKRSISIQIFDANGRFLVQLEPSSFPYDMSRFEKGIYFLEIQTETSKVSKSIMIE